MTYHTGPVARNQSEETVNTPRTTYGTETHKRFAESLNTRRGNTGGPTTHSPTLRTSSVDLTSTGTAGGTPTHTRTHTHRQDGPTTPGENTLGLSFDTPSCKGSHSSSKTYIRVTGTDPLRDCVTGGHPTRGPRETSQSTGVTHATPRENPAVKGPVSVT